MTIDIGRLDFTFSKPPLVIGKSAMAYYNLIKSSKDITLIVDLADFEQLIRRYPERLIDYRGEIGISPFNFEIFQSNFQLDYDLLSPNAKIEGTIGYVTLTNLLLLTSLDLHNPHRITNINRITKKISEELIASDTFHRTRLQQLLHSIPKTAFIKKS